MLVVPLRPRYGFDTKKRLTWSRRSLLIDFIFFFAFRTLLQPTTTRSFPTSCLLAGARTLWQPEMAMLMEPLRPRYEINRIKGLAWLSRPSLINIDLCTFREPLRTTTTSLSLTSSFTTGAARLPLGISVVPSTCHHQSSRWVSGDGLITSKEEPQAPGGGSRDLCLWLLFFSFFPLSPIISTRGDLNTRHGHRKLLGGGKYDITVFVQQGVSSFHDLGRNHNPFTTTTMKTN